MKKISQIIGFLLLAMLTLGSGHGGGCYSNHPTPEQLRNPAPVVSQPAPAPQMSIIRMYSETGQLIQMWTNVPTTSISINSLGQTHFTDMNGQRVAVVSKSTIVEGTPY